MVGIRTAIGAGFSQLLNQSGKYIMNAAGSTMAISALTVTIIGVGVVIALTKKGILQCLFGFRFVSLIQGLIYGKAFPPTLLFKLSTAPALIPGLFFL